jgi:hypothetical protein
VGLLTLGGVRSFYCIGVKVLDMRCEVCHCGGIGV